MAKMRFSIIIDHCFIRLDQKLPKYQNLNHLWDEAALIYQLGCYERRLNIYWTSLQCMSLMNKFGWAQSPVWKLLKVCCMISKNKILSEIVVPSSVVSEKMPRTKMLPENNVSSRVASVMIVLHIRTCPNTWCTILGKPKHILENN